MEQKIIDNKQKTTPPQGNEKIVVSINIDKQSLLMADKMTDIREIESRSDYIRRLIRADYRRELKRQQRLAERQPS